MSSIARLPRPCAVGSMGRRPSVESSLTPASTVQSSASFVLVWSWGPPHRVCPMPCWTAVANARGSMPVDAGAPTPRMDWRVCVLSIAWRVSGKPSALPLTVWPSSPRRGSRRIARRHGRSAMGGAWRMTADPRGKTTVTPMRKSVEPMARPDCPRCIPPKHQHGCARGLPSRHDAVWGASHALWSPGACIGGRKKRVFHRQGC
jgi:hypothetical protein